MTFADKLMRLRRQKGWSQEELADKLDVTRQAVSRWEGAQTYPDLPKLLQIGEIFDVSLDYLLKNEIEEAHTVSVVEEHKESGEKLDCAEVDAYLRKSVSASACGAVATAFFILAPIICIYFLYAGFTMASIPALISAVLSGVIPFVCILIASASLVFAIKRVGAYEKQLGREFYLDEETQKNVQASRDGRKKVRVSLLSFGVLFLLTTAGMAVGAILDGLNQVYYFIFGVLISADLAASCFMGAYLLDKPFRILSEKGKYEKKSRRFAKAVISVVYWVIVSLIFCANFLWFDNKDIAVAAIVVGAIIYFAVFFALLYMNSGKKRS